MAKVSALFVGSSSYGDRVEVAQSVSGQWFTRQYVSMGRFGYAWQKWTVCAAPEYANRVLNHCEYAAAPEYVDLPEGQTDRIQWGFNVLNKVEGKTGYRLPA